MNGFGIPAISAVGIVVLRLTVAAFLEVLGDATVRKYVQEGHSFGFLLTGGVALLLYSVIVNRFQWNFSTTLGIYVVAFAWCSNLWGHYVDGDAMPTLKVIGLLVITLGAILIQASTKIEYFGH